ncbi:MAG: hypothetical protein ACLQLC_12535 [Candidatus Sulfotelmatobacter sp.]
MRHVLTLAICLLLALPAIAHQKPWIEVRSPHFRVLTNGRVNDARHLAKEFEQMRYVLADRYPQFRLEGGAPLTILAALDESTAKSLEPILWNSKQVKPAGIFHHGWEKEYALVRLDTLGGEGGTEIVYHEYTHTVFRLNFQYLPVWLDEGLANFYGYTRFQDHKIYVGALPPRYGMPGTSLIPVETLINVSQSSNYYRDESKVYQFYAESWALVHYLIFGPGMERGKRLNQFTALLQQGMDQGQAFQQVFGNPNDVDHALAVYLSKPALQNAILPDPTQIDEKAFASRTMSAAETEAELASYHIWTRDFEGAKSLIKQALKDDPKLGLAHEIAGFLDFSEGKDGEALKEFTEASAVDGKLPLALFAKTMLSPMAASDAAADEDAFRDALLRVVELNPQFAPAYVQLARLALRQNDLETAFGLSRRAEQLEPSLAGYHIQSGEILLRMGKGAEAATFAKFVAQRWTRTDHDEAVELWDAIPSEQRPPGETLAMSVWEGMQTLGGTVKSVTCSAPVGFERDITLVLAENGRTLTLRGQHTFWGFSDTIWYGADHFSLCHNVEGMRAVVHFRPVLDASYAGDLVDVDIRNDLPQVVAKDRAQARP